MERPDTRYAGSGEFAIAYQVMGDGVADLVYLPFFMSNVEVNWQVAPLAAFTESLSLICRLVVMDRRGVGCSDRLSPGETPTLEEIADDIVAVMEAAACGSRTYLLAGQETALAAMLAAATHPDRFAGLILFSATASFRRTEDMPWQWSEDQWAAQVGRFRRISNARDAATGYVRDAMPSLAGDRSLIGPIAALFATTMGIAAALDELRMASQTDLRHLLPSIRTPTLVLHRTHDQTESIESGRFLAARIPGARFVELPGRDAQPWAGDSSAVIDEIREFVTGTREAPEPTRRLATVLFTDIVGSTERAAMLGDAAWREVIERHDDLARATVQQFRGEVVKGTGDGMLATFDGPARAVRCAQAFIIAAAGLGLEIRAGLHTGEIAFAARDLAGLGVHIAARVAAMAGAGEVWASSTVKDLTAGSGLTFEDAGEHELKGVPDRWHLYRVG